MILVTGATANIGAELVKKLSAGGHAVRAFVRSRTGAGGIALPGTELIEVQYIEVPAEALRQALIWHARMAG